MKKSINTIVLIMISLAVHSQIVKLDSSYIINGINKLEIVSGADEKSLLSVIQNDKKIVICGGSYDPILNKTIAFVSRYLENGDLDTNFNHTGINLSSSINNFFPSSIALQNDNKIVVGGHQNYLGQDYGMVVRYTSSGKIDSSFNQLGYVKIPFENAAQGKSITIQGNKIILVGNVSNIGLGDDFFCARINDAGTMDSTFGTNGIVEKYIAGNGICRGVAVLDNNKIILSGHNSTILGSVLVKYDENGVEDLTFENIFNNNDFYKYSVLYQSFEQNDHKIVSIGFAVDSVSNKIKVYAIRLLSSGVKDPSFGTNGEFIFQRNNEDTYGIYGVQHKDNHIVIVGNTGEINTFKMGLFAIALDSFGKIDSMSFNNGIFYKKLSDDYDLLNCVVFDKDNSIYASGFNATATMNFYEPVIVKFDIKNKIINTIVDKINYNVQLYPNPLINSKIFIENSNDIDMKLIIVDISGRELPINKNILKKNSVNIYSIEMESGIYFFNLYSTKGKFIKSFKVIK